MKRHHLIYPLTDGYVDDWLVLGPCDGAVDSRPEPGEAELAYRQRLLDGLDRTQPDFPAPMEVGRYACGEKTLFWAIKHCEADHLLDWSRFCPAHTHLRGWAFAALASSSSQRAALCVTTTAPVTLWLDGKLVGHCGHSVDLDDQTPRSYRFEVALKQRDNALLVRTDQIARGHAALAVAVRVEGIAEKSVRVKVPTVTENLKERLAMERTLQFAYLDRAVYTRDDSLHLIGPEGTPGEFSVTMRVQTPDGWTYGESYGSVGAGKTIDSVDAVTLPVQGVMEAFLMPPLQLYYELGMRAQRSLPFWVANRSFAQAPEQAGADRVADLLREAARGSDLYAEYAQMVAGWWDTVNRSTIQAAIGRITRNEADCFSDLLGLIGMRVRVAGHERFPADMLPEIDAAIMAFDYAGALDDVAVGEDGRAPLQEFEQILLCASRILAGQLFGKNKFPSSGLTGRQERSRGEKLALAWLQQRAQTGFSLWNSHADEIVTALAHLVSLAKNEQVTDLSAVLLDKVLFGIAIHSFRGTFGGCRAAAEPASLRTGRLAPEAAISRLMWGMGGYENGLRAALSLVFAGDSYSFPLVIDSVANDFQSELWARERHQIVGNGQSSSGSSSANLATYRTADFMLSSAQDYRPGQRGAKEHVWQATMGPEALVFTNHPASFSQSDSREAGWWRGNGSLPRVAQWKDALIALYNLPEDARLRFTHAYFPSYAFEESVVEEGWAFARTGDAYIALYASQGLELMQRGLDAHRELRSPGLRNAWLCQMGSRDTDSSFDNFRSRVMASKPEIEGLHVAWKTLRGDRLEFDWGGPLLLNGAEQPITGFKHHESIYANAEFPAETMDIAYGEDIMRLHLA